MLPLFSVRFVLTQVTQRFAIKYLFMVSFLSMHLINLSLSKFQSLKGLKTYQQCLEEDKKNKLDVNLI